MELAAGAVEQRQCPGGVAGDDSVVKVFEDCFEEGPFIVPLREERRQEHKRRSDHGRRYLQ